MISRDKFNQVMNHLSFVYTKDFPDETIHELYFQIFSMEFDNDEEFGQAALKVIKTRVFPSFPKPAEFLEALKIKDDLEGKSLVARIEVEKAISKYGAYKNVCFDDPIIHACIRDLFGGWVKACTWELKEFDKIMTFEFPTLYTYYAKNKIKNIPIYLTGIASNDNNNNGMKEDFQIEYVGDEEKCKKWTTLYFNKNSGELLNQNKYIQLGYKQEDILRIEQHESPIKSVSEMIEDLTEDLGLIKEVKKPLTGVEYTQEQLLKQYKSAYPVIRKIEQQED